MHYSQVFNTHNIPEEFGQFLSAMPKTETHVHLEGATDASLIFKMARRNQVSLPVSSLEEWVKFYEFRDFDHFIEIYLLSVACMKTPQDFIDMVVDFMKRQAEQNILYTEAYISPALHAGKMPDEELIEALYQGVGIGSERYHVKLAFIPDISREMCADRTRQNQVLDFAIKTREKGIGVALGIGGKEIGFPPHLYKDVFSEARQAGLHIVAHGGETGGPDSIRGAIHELGAERIGHGIHSLWDTSLVEEIKERQIPIEVSPQSNYCTRAVNIDEPHPIRRMVDAGFFCTLNSDDPPMFSTSLTNEYLTLAAQGFTREELWQLNLNGLASSFMEIAMKNEFRSRWNEFALNSPDLSSHPEKHEDTEYHQ